MNIRSSAHAGGSKKFNNGGFRGAGSASAGPRRSSGGAGHTGARSASFGSRSGGSSTGGARSSSTGSRPSYSDRSSGTGARSSGGRSGGGFRGGSGRPSGNFGGGRSGGGFRGGSGGNRGGGRGGRFKGENINASRFIKKAEHVDEVKYVPVHAFSDFPFSKKIHENLAKKGFVHPTPIQDQAIMSVLEGRDIFGLANTGTGKTGAFLLPLIERVSGDANERVLILAPTRELAIQIETDFRDFAHGMGLYSVACVGGLNIRNQMTQLKRKTNFIIGTPGRVKDLIERKAFDPSVYGTIVLDEADRMLDMGFRPDMKYILSRTKKERHTLFFSATLSTEIKKLTEEFLKNPVFVSVITGETSKNVDQDVIKFKDNTDKLDSLHDVLIKEGSSKVLIFREMKSSVDRLCRELKDRGFKVGGIHGDKRNRERLRTLDAFKKGEIGVLIATDVAARGLDIPNVTHVINYDVPSTYDTYVHRIGRTGRGGKKGIALTFVPI